MIIHPSKSHVVQVRGSQIVPSKTFPANFTLRFPRFVKVRTHEKAVHEALTKSELEECFSRFQGRTIKDNVISHGVGKKKLKISHGRSVIPDFVGIKSTNLMIESDIFANSEFCVMLKSSDVKLFFEETIIKNGGIIAQIPSTDKTKMIIADEISKIIEGLINSFKFSCKSKSSERFSRYC